MDTYICRMCGHVYDPVKGEAKKSTDTSDGCRRNRNSAGSWTACKSGNRFFSFPADWKCPVCGVSKSYFRKQMPERLADLRTIA